MNSLGLVVHDEQIFLTKVINSGMEQGIFTRDRADEIIRISVAMANKYVLQQEIDFRSEEELAKVQETILKLVGVGLEIKSSGDEEEGIRLIMESSPVSLFRLAYTRIDTLRNRWRRLLLNHRVEILVSSDEFDCLSDLTCQRLSEMSVFTDSEIYTIQSITLDDELFTTLGIVDYYESEVERYEFILRLKDILPFKMLNLSPNVHAESLSEVDSIREAVINTLIISTYLDCPDPVSLQMKDVRDFLTKLDMGEVADPFPEDLEDVVLDVIQELGEGLEEREGSILAREIIKAGQKLLETITKEGDTVNSPSENTFYKRWSRLVILSDIPDPISRILACQGILDEFDFEVLVDQLSISQEKDALVIIEKLPWANLQPDQIIRLFHQVQAYQPAFSKQVSLTGLSPAELIDLLEGIDSGALKVLAPALKKVMGQLSFNLEELELLEALYQADAVSILRMANPPADHDLNSLLVEYREGSEKVRRVIFYSCCGSDFFPDLFREAWSIDHGFVKKLARGIHSADIGTFLLNAAGQRRPTILKSDQGPELEFQSRELNVFFKSLPEGKKSSAVRFFTKNFRL